MLIIADSSALIALSTCHALELLTALYDDVKVPQAVYDEVVISDKPQAKRLAKFLTNRIVDVDITRFVVTIGDLGQGEMEAMALYKVSLADFLLIDDRRARAIAEANNIHCIGSLGILLQAKQKKHVVQVSPYVQILKDSPLHYSEELLDKVIQLAGD